MNPRRLVVGACIVVASVTTTCAVAAVIVAHALRAASGEWSVPMRVGLFGLGPVVDVGASRLVRVATHPVGIALLDGRQLRTSVGTLTFTKLDRDRLAIDCARCRMRLPGLGDGRIDAPAVHATVLRHADRLTGTLAMTASRARVEGRWGADLDAHGMRIDADLGPAPLASWFALVIDAVPEARVATIDGSASFAVHASWPAATIAVEPSIDGFAVSGLGTETLSGRWPDVRCGSQARTTTVDARTHRAPSSFGRWLPGAVLAAEDQRFHEHPGYDLVELAASLSRNGSSSNVERGASTIPQQLARLLYAGSARTPARKLRELLYAVEMERTLGKPRMLALYLAIAPWGAGTCGADAAAHRYFGVAPNALTAAQAVWLAAMLHAPETEAARWRANGTIDLVRAAWVANGMPKTTRAARRRVIASLSAIGPPPSSSAPAPADAES